MIGSTNYQIGVNIDANSARGAARTISVADRALNTFGNTAAAFSSSVTSMGAAYGNAVSSFSSGNPYIIAASVAVSGLAIAANQSVEALQRAGTFDASRRGLIAVSENATLAADKLKELEKVAADTQGLTFRQAVNAQRNLQAAKIEANEATREIKTFANAVALVGGGEEEFKGVLTALTQIASKSKISAEEINQLAERMPQIRTAIQNVYGTADTEILQKRGIDPKDFLRDITTELEKMPKAQGSVIGGWENLTDAIDKAYIRVGDPALPNATSVLDRLTKFIDKNSATWDSWGRKVSTAIDTVDKAITVLDFAGDTQLPSFFTYLDDIAFAGLNAVGAGIRALGSDIEAYNKAQEKSSVVAQKSIADLRKMDDTMRAASETIKETYDDRLKAIDNFHKLAVSKAGAGIRVNKNQELSYQKELLRVETSTYTQRIAALDKYYADRIAKAKTFAEREQLIKEGKTAKSEATLDFTVTKQNIEKNIGDLQQIIKDRTNGILNEALQQELEKASTNMKATLDGLSTSFEKGGIDVQQYWDSAVNALNTYYKEFDRIKRAQYALIDPQKALNTQELENERNRVVQALDDARRDIGKQGDMLKDELINYIASANTAAASRIEAIDAAGRETTSALIRFYSIFKDNPNISIDPVNGLNADLRKAAAKIKETYGKMILSASATDEELLRVAQDSAEAQLVAKKQSLQNQIAIYTSDKKKQIELQEEIKVVDANLLALRAKNFADYVEFKVNKAKEAAQAEIEVTQMVSDAATDAETALVNLQEAAIESGLSAGKNLQAVYEASRIARQSLLDNLDRDRARLESEKKNALERVKGKENEEKLKSDIEEAYRLKNLGLEREYQQKLLEIGREFAQKKADARFRDAQQNQGNSGAFLDGIFGSDKVGAIQSEADYIKDVYRDLGATVGDVMQGMIDAGGQLLETWILTGEAGGAAIAQFAASTIAGIATQAGIKAIFELAEGWAAAARYDPVSATGHFTAAKIYGAVSLSALGSGLAIGAAGGLQGGGSRKGQQNAPDYQIATGSTSGGLRSTNQNLLTSGGNGTNSLSTAIQGLRDEVGGLREKIGSMKPEDVLTVGVKRSGTFITDVTISQVKNSSSKKKDLGTALRLR